MSKTIIIDNVRIDVSAFAAFLIKAHDPSVEKARDEVSKYIQARLISRDDRFSSNAYPTTPRGDDLIASIDTIPDDPVQILDSEKVFGVRRGGEKDSIRASVHLRSLQRKHV